MTIPYSLFAGNGSIFSFVFDVYKPDGVIEDTLIGCTIEASLIGQDGAELISDIAQSSGSSWANWPAARVEVVFPFGSTGTDNPALISRVGQVAYVEVTITRGGVPRTYRADTPVKIMKGH